MVKPPVCTADKNGQSCNFVPLVNLYGAKRKNITSTFYMCHVVKILALHRLHQKKILILFL